MNNLYRFLICSHFVAISQGEYAMVFHIFIIFAAVLIDRFKKIHFYARQVVLCDWNGGKGTNPFIVMPFIYGLPDCLLYRLQRAQNTAARLVSCVHKSALITPILIKLHWFPIQYRLMYKVVNGCSPSYLADLVSENVTSPYLRNSEANNFVVPRTFSNFDDRRFSTCGSSLWNNLPTDIKSAKILSQFRTLLKTFFTPKLMTPNYIRNYLRKLFFYVAGSVKCY